jgi:hypothetical protein
MLGQTWSSLTLTKPRMQSKKDRGSNNEYKPEMLEDLVPVGIQTTKTLA